MPPAAPASQLEDPSPGARRRRPDSDPDRGETARCTRDPEAAREALEDPTATEMQAHLATVRHAGNAAYRDLGNLRPELERHPAEIAVGRPGSTGDLTDRDAVHLVAPGLVLPLHRRGPDPRTAGAGPRVPGRLRPVRRAPGVRRGNPTFDVKRPGPDIRIAWCLNRQRPAGPGASGPGPPGRAIGPVRHQPGNG